MARCVKLIALSVLSVGCLQEPPPNRFYPEAKKASEEVFRVFCRRVARDVHPTDPTGDRFVAMCDGQAEVDENPRLQTLIGRRDNIVEALDQVFGDESIEVEGTERFEENEISGFLSKLVPLYDMPNERIPKATRNIANLLVKLLDENDPRAVQVIETIARLSQRQGYRSPELVLGAVRPILAYDGFDTLAETLLTTVAEGGSAHEEWVNVLRAAALELADDAVKTPPNERSTLSVALDLLLKTDPLLAGSTGALPVLDRDSTGNALKVDAAAADLPTPFLVAQRDDSSERDLVSTLAVSGGQPLFQTFDANQTILAGVMRETSRLIGRDGEERSGLENAAHGLRPLLGPWGARTFKIGQNDYAFEGPDVKNSPMLEFMHALASLARYPETEVLIKVLGKIVEEKENDATAFDYALLAVDKLADNPMFANAKLNGPHEFWDDLIQAGDRILTRNNLVEALIRSFTKPESAQQGKLFATWMKYSDEVTYKGAPMMPTAPNGAYTTAEATDLNVTPVEHTYMQLVDRDMPDVAGNRSIWQRTMSLINSLNGVPVCNKKGAILNVPTGLGVFTFPAGNPAGYEECAFIQFQDAVEIYSLSLLGKAKVTLKDDIALGLAAVGGGIGVVGTVPQITEDNSQLKGFRDTLTPESMARFLFAPNNKFLSDLFVPLQSKYGVAIKDYEPYALFPLEVKDPNAGNESFLKLGIPLIEAFDTAELRDAEGKLPDGYMFGNLLSVLHKHWPQRKDTDCVAPVEPGCTQNKAPADPFYSPQTGLVSYEELIAKAFEDEDLVGILHQATLALEQIKVPNKDGVEIDGIKALSDFIAVAMRPDETLATRDGKTSTKTNLCVESGGACANDVGRIIPVYTPLYLVLDSLKQIDETFDKPENADRLDIWHAGRSKIVDQLLSVTRTGAAGSYKYELADRNAYAIFIKALPWVTDQIAAHRAAGDIVPWSSELSNRLGKVLSHPLAAAVVDLLEKFWDEEEASGEFIKISESVLNETTNPKAYRGMLVAAADTIKLLDKDPELSPAIQFASLALAPNAFEALDSNEEPNVTEGALYAGTELAREVIVLLREDQEPPTTIAKMLRNVVLSDGQSRSPAEELIDITADVNRTYSEQPTEVPLAPEEINKVFADVKGFLYDTDGEKRSLERLYSVIQNRTLKGQANN